MLFDWTENLNVWLPKSLITLAQNSTLEYFDAMDIARSEFYIGADFCKHKDPPVVAVINSLKSYFYLRHIH